MAKKMSVASTLKLPPNTIGLPKSAMLSMKLSRKALARPGRISGRVTVAKVCMGEARSVCAASSTEGLTPSTTPMITRKAMGVKASVCAIQIPVKP